MSAQKLNLLSFFNYFVPQLSINIPPPEALFLTERVITKLEQHPPPSSEQLRFPEQLADSRLCRLMKQLQGPHVPPF